MNSNQVHKITHVGNGTLYINPDRSGEYVEYGVSRSLEWEEIIEMVADEYVRRRGLDDDIIDSEVFPEDDRITYFRDDESTVTVKVGIDGFASRLTSPFARFDEFSKIT